MSKQEKNNKGFQKYLILNHLCKFQYFCGLQAQKLYIKMSQKVYIIVNHLYNVRESRVCVYIF